MRAWLLFALLLSLAALILSQGWRPPDRYNPWAPLDLQAAPDAFFRYKLQSLTEDPAMCRAAIRDAGAVFTALTDREEASGCGWHNAVRLTAVGDTQLDSAVIVTCPLAASLTLFNRQVLQPASQGAFASSVRVIEHVGSYSCRNIYHRQQAPLSHHARADAIDLTGFQLANGRRVNIASAWDSAREGAFLHAVHRRGCRYFGALFGPDYNAAHRTHFHAQGGSSGYCR